jgi:hypothetical protein
MKIYIAMAETEDGTRIMENAYLSRSAAELATEVMIKDINENAGWTVIPIIEEMDLINE